MERAAGGDQALVGKELKITATVLDWFENTTAAGHQSALVYHEDIQIVFLGGNVATFKPDLPFRVSVSMKGI